MSMKSFNQVQESEQSIWIHGYWVGFMSALMLMGLIFSVWVKV